MKQLAVVSGKGGTGKTTVTAALAALAPEPVLADCDVDAPDLHLLLEPHIESREEFHGLKVADIDAAACAACDLCIEACRFGAISDDLVVDRAACEGCGTCVVVNRADLYIREADAIEEWCRERGVEVLQRLPYDAAATEAMIQARTVVEYGDGPLAQAIQCLWIELAEIMGLDDGDPDRCQKGATLG